MYVYVPSGAYYLDSMENTIAIPYVNYSYTAFLFISENELPYLDVV